jgi:hypothetical protein
MHDLRKNLCAVVVVAALSAVAIPAFAGYAGIEGGPTPASAQPGIVGGVIAHLKREDDEQEVQAIAEQQPSLSERQAGREQREEASEAQAPNPQPEQEDEG